MARDKNAPKRPLSAYFQWLQENRAEIVSSLPEADRAKVQVVAKIAGERWKQVPESEKAPFKEAYAKAKKVWEKEQEAYKQTDEYKVHLEEVSKAKKKKARKFKDKNAPKKPAGAYMFFCNEKRAEVKATHNLQTITEVAKKLGELWRALDSAGKGPYNKQAELAKAEYEKAWKAYEGSEEHKQFEAEKKKLNAAAKDPKEKEAEAAKKKATKEKKKLAEKRKADKEKAKKKKEKEKARKEKMKAASKKKKEQEKKRKAASKKRGPKSKKRKVTVESVTDNSATEIESSD